ncbi:MAG: hypothetical protein ACJAS4_003806 [Bacteriovoracaceae bacterium]|jgi:hypothetical protein
MRKLLIGLSILLTSSISVANEIQLNGGTYKSNNRTVECHLDVVVKHDKFTVHYFKKPGNWFFGCGGAGKTLNFVKDTETENLFLMNSNTYIKVLNTNTFEANGFVFRKY